MGEGFWPCRGGEGEKWVSEGVSSFLSRVERVGRVEGGIVDSRVEVEKGRCEGVRSE